MSQPMSGQATQILILLGEMKGQLSNIGDKFDVIHERIQRQDERMSRQDDRVTTAEEKMLMLHGELQREIASLKESRAKLIGGLVLLNMAGVCIGLVLSFLSL